MLTFKQFAAALCAAKLFNISSHGKLWPLHFKFASYAYVMQAKMEHTAIAHLTGRGWLQTVNTRNQW